MIARVAVAAVLACCVTNSPARGSSTDATVELITKPCAFQTHAFQGASLTYTIQTPSGNTVAEKYIDWNSNDPRQLHWTARIPAGVYEYDIQSRIHDDDLPCMGPGSFAILPGDSRRISAPMYGGLSDPIVPLHIYGTAPFGVAVSIQRFDDSLPCNAAIPDAAGSSIAVERDDIGYYAQDTTYDGREDNHTAVFGVRVQRANAEPRTIRITGDYPSRNIAVPPTWVRFDLTQQVLDAAYKGRPGTLLCVVPPG
jgi:hypothetical protein